MIPLLWRFELATGDGGAVVAAKISGVACCRGLSLLFRSALLLAVKAANRMDQRVNSLEAYRIYRK